jgi:hypothetical protein
MFMLLKSITCGLFLGFFQALMFKVRSNRLFTKIPKQTDQLPEKALNKQKLQTIFRFASFSLISNLLLILLLAFLIIKYEINIPIAIISLMFSFWTFTFIFLKRMKTEKDF